MNRIVEVAKEFYTDLYSSSSNSDGNDAGRVTYELDIPPVTSEEVRKARAAMRKGKSPGEDQVTADLLKDGGEIVVETLAALYSCLKTPCVPESSKNAKIVLIHKKGNVKDLKNYRLTARGLQVIY